MTPAFFQNSHAAQTGRRRQPDLRGKVVDTHAAIGLQQVENFPVYRIEVMDWHDPPLRRPLLA